MAVTVCCGRGNEPLVSVIKDWQSRDELIAQSFACASHECLLGSGGVAPLILNLGTTRM